MTIPVYHSAHLGYAERMAKLAAGLGLEVTLFCNSAAALEGALERGLAVATSNDNVGYGRAANISVEGKDFDWLIVCNDDLSVDHSDFRRYIKALQEQPGAEPWLVGLRDPASTRRYKIPGPMGVFTSLSLLQAIHVRIAQGWSRGTFDGTRPTADGALVELQPGEAFPFTCVAINRAAWLGLGGFDPRFDLYFEDMDLLIRSSKLTNAHAAIIPAGMDHLGSASTRKVLATTLPVATWSAYQYLILHTHLGPRAARLLVGAAVALRVLFLPIASAPPGSHLVGIANSLAAIIRNKRPRLPQWHS